MATARASAFRIVLAVVVVFGLGWLAGARPVYTYEELRCAPGLTAQPVSIAAWAIACRPDRSAETGSKPWPDAAVVRHEVGLYLRNLGVRIFHLDFVGGTAHWLAWGVPAPGPDY